jgi:hypothetical protein
MGACVNDMSVGAVEELSNEFMLFPDGADVRSDMPISPSMLFWRHDEGSCGCEGPALEEASAFWSTGFNVWLLGTEKKLRRLGSIANTVSPSLQRPDQMSMTGRARVSGPDTGHTGSIRESLTETRRREGNGR